MHARIVVTAEYRLRQYHCCGQRFLHRDAASRHLSRHRKNISYAQAYDLVAALGDHGAVKGCDACRRTYVPKRYRAKKAEARLSLYTQSEMPDDTPVWPLPGERLLAVTVLRLAITDANGGGYYTSEYDRIECVTDAHDFFACPRCPDVAVWCEAAGIDEDVFWAWVQRTFPEPHDEKRLCASHQQEKA